MCFVTMCDAPILFEAKLVRARKPHRCCECRREIKPGSRYETAFGIWEGEASRFATCLLCYDLRGCVTAAEIEAGCDYSESSPPFGALKEALRYKGEDGDGRYPDVPEAIGGGFVKLH